jgi:hypothetical protein
VSALEPSLTAYDRRVLLAVPEGGDVERRLREDGPSRTVWQVAEALNTVEVAGLAQVLRGLERFGYVTSSKRHRGGRTVWWRTCGECFAPEDVVRDPFERCQWRA